MSKLIIANWKSNKKIAAVAAWWESFQAAQPDLAQNQVSIAAPFTALPLLQAKVAGTSVALAAQDVSPYPFGSYTGEIAAEQLSDLGVKFAIVGHSERRRHFGESSEQVARKVGELLSQEITPILCIDTPYLAEQAAALTTEQRSACIVAYEPVAAIGSGVPATVGDVTQVADQIRAQFGPVQVIYGGSVTERDVQEFMLVADGVLVGGASLDGTQFAALVTAAARH